MIKRRNESDLELDYVKSKALYVGPTYINVFFFVYLIIDLYK